MQRQQPERRHPNDLYEALVAALRSEPRAATSQREAPPERHAVVFPAPPEEGRGAGASRAAQAPTKLPRAASRGPLEDEGREHLPRTSSVAPVALTNLPPSQSTESSLPSPRRRQRRALAAGAAIVMAAGLGLVGAHLESERNALTASPRFLWRTDAAAAARAMLSLPESGVEGGQVGFAVIPSLTRARAGLPPLTTPSRLAAPGAPLHITTPLTVIAAAPERSEPLHLAVETGQPRKAAALGAGPGRRRDGQPRAGTVTPGGPADHAPPDGRRRPGDDAGRAPGSLEVLWIAEAHSRLPTTERQLQPTRLQPNRSPRTTPLLWGPPER